MGNVEGVFAMRKVTVVVLMRFPLEKFIYQKCLDFQEIEYYSLVTILLMMN